MSLALLNPSHKLLDLIKTLALLGYSQIHEAEEGDQMLVARAWLIENVDLADREDAKTKALPAIWTRSVCAQVLEWSEFNRDCNAMLQMAFRRSPLDLARELYIDPVWNPDQPALNNVIQMTPKPQNTYQGDPAA